MPKGTIKTENEAVFKLDSFSFLYQYMPKEIQRNYSQPKSIEAFPIKPVEHILSQI